MKNLALKSYSFILLFFSVFYLTAQEELPKGLTETERELLPQFQFNSHRLISDPSRGTSESCSRMGRSGVLSNTMDQLHIKIYYVKLLKLVFKNVK